MRRYVRYSIHLAVVGGLRRHWLSLSFWKCLKWFGWVSIHLCTSVHARGWYASVSFFCFFSFLFFLFSFWNIHMWARRTELRSKWKKIRVIGADAAGCAHKGDKGRRYGPGPNCQLLVITLIPPLKTDTKAKPTEWLTAVQIARDKTCTPLNHLLDLVVIGRHASLYVSPGHQVQQPENIGAVLLEEPSQNSCEEKTVGWHCGESNSRSN